ncbi:MAG TPA: SIMPL domain-containing protein, partial [Gammaproteobacteria bacterium]|nr:SIMPL domain-containing protein [Gammaproteobacteria bacterium]
ISRYGALVDGLFTAGVTRLDGVAPDTSEREKLQQQALADAVADAHARAASLAGGAGVTLGPVFSIAEQGGMRGPRPMMMMGAMSREAGAAPPEYLNGEIDIDADVQVYYLIGK